MDHNEHKLETNAARDRYIAGETSEDTFRRRLIYLGFNATEIQSEIDFADSERGRAYMKGNK